MKSKRLVLRDIKPNAGIGLRYRAELNRLLRSVRDEVNALVEQYGMEPAPVAMDAAPLAEAVDRLLANWVLRLGDMADKIAAWFVKGTLSHYDGNLRRQLRRGGFTVRLQMTDYTREALRASIGENVGLIRSIPTEYLAQVSKYVHAATAGGFDLGTLTNNLQHAYHIGRNRAKLIARDQANKANAVIEQARRKELGITKAIWMHSAAAKVPRPSHVAANGKEFDVEKGMYLDGKWVLPGQEINCGCTSRSVIEW